MKTFKLFLFPIALFLFVENVSAQMAVSDASLLAQSRLQYIEALNTVSSLREQLAKTKELFNVTEEMKNGVGEMRTIMSTVYNNTFGLVGELSRLRDDILATPAEFEEMMEEFAKNANCLFDDMEKYQQVETMYKARFIFVDEYGGTPEYEADDPYIWEDGSASTGQIAGNPVQLQENPCGYYNTFNHVAYANYQQERKILERVIGKINRTEEEAKENLEFYTKMDEKVKSTKNEKETLDTMKAILWSMHSHVESLDKTLLDLADLVVTRIHDPKKYLNAPGLTAEGENLINQKSIKLGEATEFKKRLSVWKALGKLKEDKLLK